MDIGDDRTTQDIMRIAQTLVEQNYYPFHDTTYIQIEGLAMGAPTLYRLSEVYLECMEYTTIYELLIKHKVEGYLCTWMTSFYSTKTTKQTYTMC